MQAKIQALQGEEHEYEQIEVISRKNPQCSSGKKSDGHFPDGHSFTDCFLLGVQQNPGDQVAAQYKKEND
jgi:hypothetical protein